MQTPQPNRIKIIVVGAVAAGIAALGLGLTATAHAQADSRVGICQVGVDSPCNGGAALPNPY